MPIKERAGWAILVLGFWTLISPWAAPFLGVDPAWSGIFAGALTVVGALWVIFGEKRPPQPPQ